MTLQGTSIIGASRGQGNQATSKSINPSTNETLEPTYISATSEDLEKAVSGRIHFHIPLYAEPTAPLSSTQGHAEDAIDYLKSHSGFCTHFEIETYTWGVLPQDLQLPIEDQIAQEYAWVLGF